MSGWWDDFFRGSLVVAQVFDTPLVLMVISGPIGAVAKPSENRLARNIAGAYTVIFRGTPEILVILLFYFGAAITLTAIAQHFDPQHGLQTPPSAKFSRSPVFPEPAILLARFVDS